MKFRTVPMLSINDTPLAEVSDDNEVVTLLVDFEDFNVADMRRLRDWLTAALPTDQV